MSEGSTIVDGVLTARGENVAIVAMALSSHIRIQILNFIKKKEVDIQQITEPTKQSKANAYTQIRILEGGQVW